MVNIGLNLLQNRYLTLSEIILLSDKDYAKSVKKDLLSSTSAVCSCVQLNRFAITLFSDFLSRGGSLTILANHPGRFRDKPDNQFDVYRSLITQGANVQWFRSPRLLHQKVILMAPDIVYLGSHNLSAKAFYSNHEVSIRLENKAMYDALIDRTLQFCGML